MATPNVLPDYRFATEKLCHLAATVGADGSVSPVCYLKPKPLDLRRSKWTTSPDAVTCPRCLTAMQRKAARPKRRPTPRQAAVLRKIADGWVLHRGFNGPWIEGPCGKRAADVHPRTARSLVRRGWVAVVRTVGLTTTYALTDAGREAANHNPEGA